jgi:hypothetical protein
MINMKRFLALGLSLGVAMPAVAQTSQCPASSIQQAVTQDACQQAIDLFKFMAPQLGIAITGGNATLGQGGALGGLGHFAVEVRGNLLAGDVPQLQTPSTTGAVRRTNYPTKRQLLGLPAVDGSLGLFKGLPLGLTNVGGVDLLLSAFYVPKVTADNVTVDPSTSLKIGYGLRLGLLQESLLVPGVSVTYFRRDLPTTTITGTTTNATLTVRDFDVKTTAWRLTASKNLLLISLAAGVGKDNYDQSATALGTVSGQSSQTVNLKQTLNRTNYFVDASLNLLLAKIVGELGMVSGGTVQTYNQFDTAPDKSRLYGSVGLRIGF